MSMEGKRQLHDMRIAGRIARVQSTEQFVGIIKSGRGHVDLCLHERGRKTLGPAPI